MLDLSAVQPIRRNRRENLGIAQMATGKALAPSKCLYIVTLKLVKAEGTRVILIPKVWRVLASIKVWLNNTGLLNSAITVLHIGGLNPLLRTESTAFGRGIEATEDISRRSGDMTQLKRRRPLKSPMNLINDDCGVNEGAY